MIRQRALTTIAMASLLALPLAACTSSNGEEDPTTTATSQEAPPTADPADATPQERITAYFNEADAAAAEGWPDSSYNDEYLVPELAEQVKTEDAENAETGAIITGERKLSDWTVVEEADTTATIEFCEDGTDMQATKDGEPYDISNEPGEPSVAQYKLVRDSAEGPWMIEQMGYYEEGTTCEAHFGG
ncbi:hypothetical protein M3A96_11540 [Helcobacillus massiliensis]|uniref:Uncharacterized protein n=3 Tax=Helcobacillus massiliensis TaxID=521392 RepID=A0A839QZM9_9MICO|nr:hypothetical protein [Helcobacillus massiliensis]MBB3023411.1 hypothetical protein [Helcobacillus massiliensis]MCT1558742.1 hypothetical protein [Helcobacillus massiliensis]MCT2332981.1 hypothetical protein [Helcobacillus massiliensis]MDK7742973.1 hypothetical protein [Helcobacillus massiliensis]WOO93213.1 hypothetical protein R3I40_01065 [Helcobacillus massiliensis]